MKERVKNLSYKYGNSSETISSNVRYDMVFNFNPLPHFHVGNYKTFLFSWGNERSKSSEP